jgi:Ca2+-binding EF-hand superfamily protein
VTRSPSKLWRSTSIFNLCCHLFREIIEDIDEDGSGLLEFGEFCQLAAKFLVEEDEEALKKELKEAFRIYDKVSEALECRRLFLNFGIYDKG